MAHFDIDEFIQTLDGLKYNEKVERILNIMRELLDGLEFKEKIEYIENLLCELEDKYDDLENEKNELEEQDEEDTARYNDLEKRLDDIDVLQDVAGGRGENLKYRFYADILSKTDKVLTKNGMCDRIEKNQEIIYMVTYGRFKYDTEFLIDGSHSGIVLTFHFPKDFKAQYLLDFFELQKSKNNQQTYIETPVEELGDKLAGLMLSFDKAYRDIDQFDFNKFETDLKALQYDDKLSFFNKTRTQFSEHLLEKEQEFCHWRNSKLEADINRMKSEQPHFDILWTTIINDYLNDVLQKADNYIATHGLSDRISIQHPENSTSDVQFFELHYLGHPCTLVPVANMETGEFQIQITVNGNPEKSDETYTAIRKHIHAWPEDPSRNILLIKKGIRPLSNLVEWMIELFEKAD